MRDLSDRHTVTHSRQALEAVTSQCKQVVFNVARRQRCDNSTYTALNFTSLHLKMYIQTGSKEMSYNQYLLRLTGITASLPHDLNGCSSPTSVSLHETLVGVRCPVTGTDRRVWQLRAPADVMTTLTHRLSDVIQLTQLIVLTLYVVTWICQSRTHTRLVFSAYDLSTFSVIYMLTVIDRGTCTGLHSLCTCSQNIFGVHEQSIFWFTIYVLMSGGVATSGRARSNDLSGRALAPCSCLLLCFGNTVNMLPYLTALFVLF